MLIFKRKKIISLLAEILIVMNVSDLKKYEKEYLLDSIVDICDLLGGRKARNQLLKSVTEKHTKPSR